MLVGLQHTRALKKFGGFNKAEFHRCADDADGLFPTSEAERIETVRVPL
jgi:hypothetical protein